MKSFNILISAYACRPNMGSEPGVGWNVVQELAKFHQVWVLTRSDNRSSIEAHLAQHPAGNLKFVYCDPPMGARLLSAATVPHYYFWQVAAYFAAKDLLQQVDIDVIHHVTYVRYSTPSFLSLLPVPFIWGPVGGGEMAPKAFWQDFSARGQAYEVVRRLVHRIGELDPFVQLTARRSALTRATTQETAERLQKIGASKLEVYSESGLSTDEIERLSRCDISSTTPVRFISMARLLHWKGMHLSIRAFAGANLPKDVEYWILGEGPEDANLLTLAQELGVADRVKFLGRLPRPETLQKLSECHVLVHASLHDSGGWVCLEAMAAGRPVICLDLGGPSVQVNEETGIRVPAHDPSQVVEDLALAMTRLANDAELRRQMGEAGRSLVRQSFSWEAKCQKLTEKYTEICQEIASCVS